MAVYRPTYVTRRLVKSATDINTTAEFDAQVDSAMEKAAEDIDGLCHRRFYTALETKYFDWPNYQGTYPWKIYLDESELADTTVTAPVVTSGGNVILASTIFWGPWNYSPPYNVLELNRSSNSSFGQGNTPQRDVAVTGMFGYWIKTRSAGTLAASIASTSSTTLTVSDSSQVDAGDVITIDSETMLVQDTAMADTGQAQSGSGCTTASTADNQLTVSSGAALHTNEVIQLDAERMLITSITGNIATVLRNYDGTVLATHSNAEVYALRLLTVTRGDFGSTAATHNSSTAINAARVPGEIRELALAEALNTVQQKVSAYARTIGENTRPVPGGSLPDLRAQVYMRYGRQARTRVV